MGSLAHDLLLSGVFCKTCVALQSLVFLGVTLFFLGVHAACVDGGSAYWVTPQWVGVGAGVGSNLLFLVAYIVAGGGSLYTRGTVKSPYTSPYKEG